MAYVVAATYRTNPGEEDAVRDALVAMQAASASETGCLAYYAHRLIEDPRVFFLYEQYINEQAYTAHQQTTHFATYIRGQAIPRLETRIRSFYVTLDK